MSSYKRDERGHVILQGAETFGTVTKPTGGRRQPRSHALRDREENKLIRMIEQRDVKPLTGRGLEIVEEHNRFVRLPAQERLQYFLNKKDTLSKELSVLVASNNKRKIDFIKPVILMQIKDADENISDITQEVEEQVWSSQ
jgi:hypothetical protein